MSNQLNYTSIVTGTFQRPERIQDTDIQLIQDDSKQIIFGTNPKDNVEVWMYNPDGSFAGHLRLDPFDTALILSTLTDNTGTFEILNVDIRVVGQRLALETGRYGLVLNFFRDEIGSETGYKFYLADISSDRTEVLLNPVNLSSDVLKDVYEFVESSIPRFFVKPLVDQIFGKALSAPANQQLSVETVSGLLENTQPGTLQRISTSLATNQYNAMVQQILDRTYSTTLDAIAADVQNYNVQRVEIEQYILSSLQTVLHQMQTRGEIDPRFIVN